MVGRILSLKMKIVYPLRAPVRPTHLILNQGATALIMGGKNTKIQTKREVM